MNRQDVYPLLILAMTMASTAPAAAQSRFTVTPYAGAWMVDDGLSDSALVALETDGEPRPAGSPIEVETGLLVGVRVGVPVGGSWSVEGAYGYSSFDTEIELDDGLAIPLSDSFTFFEHSAHLFLGSVRWSPLPGRRLRPFLSGGAGAVRMTREDPLLEPLGDEFNLESTDLLLTVGGGLLVPIRPGISIRAEARDDMQFCDELCGEEDATLHHIGLTGGIEIEL